MKEKTSSKGFKLALVATALAVSGAVFAAQSEAPQRFHDRGHHGAHHYGHHGDHGHFGNKGHHGFGHGSHDGRNGTYGHRGDARAAGLIVPGYGVVSQDFIDGMGLSADQLKRVQEARDASEALRERHHANRKDMREARKERYNSPFNPEQAMKQADERREKRMAEHREVEEKWLAVWKSLEPGQQEKIATHMKDRAEKAEQRAQQREERRAKREANRSEAPSSKSNT